MSYVALYIISMHVIHTNSRTSTHWKLNLESGKVQTAAVAAGGDEGLTGEHPDDPLFSILNSKIHLDNGEWKLEGQEPTCKDNCRRAKKSQKENDTDSVSDSGGSSKNSKARG